MLVWPDSVNLLGGVDEKTNFDNFGKDIPAKPLEWRRLVTPKTFSVITVRFCFVNCRIFTKCHLEVEDVLTTSLKHEQIRNNLVNFAF